MKTWNVLYKIALFVFILGLVAIISYKQFLPAIRKNKEQERKLIELEEECKRTQEAINELQEKQERFANEPEFIEDVAREELGKAKEGETVFRFEKP